MGWLGRRGEDPDLLRVLQEQQERQIKAMQAAQNVPYPAAPKLPKAETMGPIRAWRTWVFRQGTLRSVTAERVWQPGIPMWGDPSTHGVYAMKQRPTADEPGGGLLIGEVGLWGRVIEHEHGYRAEYGYPLRLVVTVPQPMPGFPRPAAMLDPYQAVADRYGVPLTVEESAP